MAFQFKQGDRPLAGYTIQRGVGRGGFGEVYYATSDGGKEVALKFLRENPQIELRGVSHCLNLKSPYLVALHDVKQNDEGDYFVIMEYVNGPSLRDLMNTEPNGLGPQKAAYFLREIGKGLAYLHDRGIVHRDLKPGNIFYEDGYVKIGDYGLAKIMAASQHSGQTMSVGTVHYMAPEVGSGNYDRTIDIYAMGVVLYEMLLGRVPFAGATMGEVLMKHLTAQPQVDELPAPFPDVIRKSLAKDPKDRYQTVNELVAELFSVADIDRSVAAFEPASLSAAAARAAADVNVTLAAPSPRGGVAVLGTGSSNVGQAADGATVNPDDAMGDGVWRLGPKLGVIARMGRTGRKANRFDDGAPPAKPSRSSAQVTEDWRGRLVQSLIVAVALSGVATLTANVRHGNSPLLMSAVVLHVVAMVQAVLVGCWFTHRHMKVSGKWATRLVITAIAFASLMPATAAAQSVVGAGWSVSLLFAMFLCDWPRRVDEAQRRGPVSMGAALWAGLFGLVASGIHGDFAPQVAGIIAAATSLCVQTIAGIWQYPRVATAMGAPINARHAARGAAAARRNDQPTPGVIVRPQGQSFGSSPVGVRSENPHVVDGAIAAPAEARDARWSAARAMWMMLSALLLCTAVMLFLAYGLLPDRTPKTPNGIAAQDKAGFIVGGVVASAYFLMALTRILPRYKVGLWRGLVRPFIFFSGVAASAGAATSIGMFNLHGEEQLGALAGVLAGGVLSLFVLLVPMPAYHPRAARGLAPRDDSTRPPDEGRLRKARGLKLAAVIVFASMFAVVSIIASTGQSADREGIPPVVIIFTMTSAGLLIGSYYVKRTPGSPSQSRVTLPIRRVFEIDANPNYPRLIERHMAVMGYSLANKSDMLWSFTRGNFAAQFYSKDVRQWGTRFNIAAYDLDHGGHRLTCVIDLDRSISKTNAGQLAALASEAAELEALLAGREVKSGSPVNVA